MENTAKMKCASILIASGLLFGAGAAHAADLVFVSSGGTFQAAQNDAFVNPYAKETGKEVTSVAQGGSLAGRIKAMVEAGDVQWDVVEVERGDYLTLLKENLVEPIDYSVFDKATLDAIKPEFREPNGIVALLYAYGIAYRTDLGKDKHPQSWQEFWDLDKFPGPRALPAGSSPTPPWEAALLASGKSLTNLYPLDFDAAKESLSKIRPSVSLWYDDTAAGVQSLVSGNVDYASLPNGRVVKAKGDGAKVDFDYGQAFLLTDYFVVPKGSPHKAEAMKFIAYASQARQSAALMKAVPYSMPNADALKLLDPAYAKSLPTDPENLAKTLKLSDTYWGEKSPDGKSWQQYGIGQWNEWYAQ